MAESNVMSILLIFAVIALLGFNILSAQRKQKARLAQMQQLHEGLKPGDSVVMTCGIHGKVAAVHDSVIELEIAPGVISVWEKVAVMERTAEAAVSDVPAEASAASAGATDAEAES